jgi:arylsulfatase A-like enzyme
MGIDFYPTLLEATGITGGVLHNASVDGRSLKPLLEDPDATLDRALFWHFPHYHAGGDSPYSAVRAGDWRLVEFHEDGCLELYNLKEDIGETKNLAATRSEKTIELHERLKRWRKDVGAQMPTANPNFDPSRQTEVAKRRRP